MIRATMRKEILISFAACFVFGACQQSDDTIKTYRLAKDQSPLLAPAVNSTASAPFAANAGGSSGETPPTGAPAPEGAMQALPGMAPAASAREIEWKTPGGWTEQAPSSMRVGSFLVKGANGGQADVSVIPLSGMAGGDLANVNRWRDQIQLPPLGENELSRNVKPMKFPAGTFKLVDFVSAKPLDQGRKKRVIAATLEQGERTWFFKMLGDDATVQKSKTKFIDFLSSVRIKGGDEN